jgi:hypothetical protein
MPSWLKRVRTIFRRASMERELDAELQFHLDMLTAEYVRQGAAPEAARRSAQQHFGGVEGIKDDVRDTWLTRLVETLGQDIRYGVRSLRKQAGYALAVVVTMVEYHSMYFILLGGDEPERVAAGVVSCDYFQTLGVTPLLGRTFRADDDGTTLPRRSC